MSLRGRTLLCGVRFIDHKQDKEKLYERQERFPLQYEDPTDWEGLAMKMD